MRFEKGQSGNPGGRRPGVCALLQKRYGKNGEKLFAELGTLAFDPETDPHVRVKALSTLLDRGWGKPKETHEHTIPEGVTVKHVFEVAAK